MNGGADEQNPPESTARTRSRRCETDTRTRVSRRPSLRPSGCYCCIHSREADSLSHTETVWARWCGTLRAIGWRGAKFNEQFFQMKTTSRCHAHTYRTFSRSSPSMGTCSDWRLLHTNRYSHSAAVPGDPAEQIRSDDCRTRMSCSWCCGRGGSRRFRIQHVWVVVGGAFNSLEGVLSELFAGSHVHGARY